jgi:hypothetical protein
LSAAKEAFLLARANHTGTQAGSTIDISDATFTGTSITLTTGVRSHYRIFTDTADQTIASLPTPTIVTELTVVNDSSFVLTFTQDSGYPEVVLQAKQAVTFFYSLAQSKWYLK